MERAEKMPTYDDWDERRRPLAYLITIRTYGTWLHGDERHSVDTHDNLNVYGMPDRPPNVALENVMSSNLVHRPTIFDKLQRSVVEAAIIEVCEYKKYTLFAQNVRSNHAHVVAASFEKPEKMAENFKKYATRRMRESGLIEKEQKVWSRGCSTRYLWKEKHPALAEQYVLYGQGDEMFAFGDNDTLG
jgi:REP element-mobilizing transposase RayT